MSIWINVIFCDGKTPTEIEKRYFFLDGAASTHRARFIPIKLGRALDGFII